MKNIFFRVTFLALLSTILYSCQKNSPSSVLLDQVQHVADNDPVKALAMLDSIDTKSLDEGDYMKYVVTRLQAKYKNSESVASDTLIFEARDYFEKKEDPRQSALAYFYSGAVYYQNKKAGKALMSFMEASAYANLSKDTILMARSQNNLGHLYYEQDVMDSAIHHYKLALNCYDKVKNVDTLKMQTIYSMTTAFFVNYDLDSAYHHLNKGLDLANRTGNQKYQSIFTKNQGIIDRVRGNYKEATEKLHWSLAHTKSSIDSSRVYLNLAKLYNTTHQLDSAQFYTSLLEKRLVEISDYDILEGTYFSLSEHNKQLGNYVDALQYKNMQSKIQDNIKAENKATELLEADKEYVLDQKEKQAGVYQMEICFWVIFAVAVLIAALILIAFIIRLNKKDKKEIEAQAADLQRLKDYLRAMAVDYDRIEAELAAVLRGEDIEDKDKKDSEN